MASNDFFLSDVTDQKIIPWEKLIQDLNSTISYNKYCYTSNYYAVFRHIIISMLLSEEAILLDADFSTDELHNLTEETSFAQYDISIPKGRIDIQSKDVLISLLNNVSNGWRITLFTSGTTGKPKKVSHNFGSIARFLKLSPVSAIWGYAYNPTHMAGVQVFLQALLNGNSIVRLFGLRPDMVLNQIEQFGITHISATPTFYKLLLPCTGTYTSVKRITSGGEKLNLKTVEELKAVFPSAKLTNIYASTEAGTLLAAKDDVFTIKPEFEQYIKIEEGELLIHNSLMGNTDNAADEYYNTGDMVELFSQQPLSFKFVSRKNDMVNVGGYKVNVAEVEDVLMQMHDVKDARVFAKENSVLGNIICCEIVKDNDGLKEADIRLYLQAKLQEFKIPRVIKFVPELTVTRTGKIKRS